ncbi:uncharacterized protein LOC118814693 isoform X2 [Colossoma macropomum]|uniref:uncharacterized protein LOC118814693 isoform X2 n=1 Tax=Colossoma macropomum TaxID=42526 RepID=UPI001864527C|nr:uncharacterized protein LOC118814693 isoform X2 [Colossoma macropomum]
MAASSNSETGVQDVERAEMVRLMMQHCREMKRHETCSRFATGFLLLTLFAAFLFVQVSGQSSKDAPSEQPVTNTGLVQARRSGQSGRHRVHSVHLLSHHPDPITEMKNDTHVIRWRESSKLKMIDNNTGLVIPSNGWYLVNLRISFRVPYGPCPCKHYLGESEDEEGKEDTLCFLSIAVKQKHSEYPGWIDVVQAKETMLCTLGSRQAINLSRVVNLKNSTVLIVTIASDNHDLISREIHDYFEITRL